MSRPNSRPTSRALLLAGAASVLLSAGCQTDYFKPRGTGFSADRFTYESTTWSPKTVELIDTRTDQTMWSVDVPVGKKLTIDFSDVPNPADPAYPDSMRWVVQPINRNSWGGAQSMAVPNRHGRLVQMTLRSAPEMPAQTAATPEPPALEPVTAPEAPEDANGTPVEETPGR